MCLFIVQEIKEKEEKIKIKIKSKKIDKRKENIKVQLYYDKNSQIGPLWEVCSVEKQSVSQETLAKDFGERKYIKENII